MARARATRHRVRSPRIYLVLTISGLSPSLLDSLHRMGMATDEHGPRFDVELAGCRKILNYQMPRCSECSEGIKSLGVHATERTSKESHPRVSILTDTSRDTSLLV